MREGQLVPMPLSTAEKRRIMRELQNPQPLPPISYAEAYRPQAKRTTRRKKEEQ